MIKNKRNKSRTFGRSSIAFYILMGFVLVLGLAIRLYDLTDPPLDFHSTRQLWSAIIARGIYYQGLDDVPEWQRELAVSAWKDKPAIEPVIFESLVAFTYKAIGEEIIWIPRIYASLFWIIGGIGLYLLACEMTSKDGGFIALVFYLFVPFGAVASRSFQPDPLMVMWIILAWWAFYRWYQSPSWKTAMLAGLFSGFAMLVKAVAIFMMFGGMAGLIMSGFGLKRAVRNPQVWIVTLLSALPVAIYTFYGLNSLGMESQFQGRFFPELLTDPTHYIRWASEMKSIVGFSSIILSLVGVLLFRDWSQRVFIIGFWVGYFIYGLCFPYHFLTHNYYHLPLIPMVALSLAPLAESIADRAVSVGLKGFGRIGLVLVVFLGVFWQVWDIRVTLAKEDFRHEPAYWEAIGEKVGQEHSVVALTQDYGDRLMYYGWLRVTNWPETGHLAYRELRGGKPFVFEDWFQEVTQDMDYFLVTRIKELDRQKDLKDTLYNHFPIADQGDGFILFDLNQPLR